MKVILLMAMTADGITAKNPFELVNWTESEDKKLFVDVTKKSGVVIMGRNTYKTIGKPLINRKNIVYSRTKRGDFPEDNLFYTDMDPVKLLEKLESENFNEVVLIGGSEINTIFAKKNLIDELMLTVSPVLFGKGLTMFTEDLNLDMTILDYEKVGNNSIFIRYSIEKQD